MTITNQEIGEYIRDVRTKLGKKMEELADDNISSSTISKIELGVEKVSTAKKIYLCDKMNVNYNDIPKLIQTKREEQKKMMIRLEYIEQSIELGAQTTALKKLRQFNPKTKQHKSIIHYLKGRAYSMKEKSSKKAVNHLQQAMNYIQSCNNEDDHNIVAASCNQLAKIAYHENQFQTALNYIDQGIDAFNEKGSKPHLQFIFLSNKAICLEKLDYIDEASIILEKLWENEHRIMTTDVLINLYDIQANIFRKTRIYTNAIQFAKDGLQLARINRNHSRVIEISLTLSRIFMDMGKIVDAKEVLTSSLDLKANVKQNHLFFPIYTQLGKVYLLEKNPVKAQQILEIAIENKSNDVVRYTEALMTLGDSLLDQGHSKNALELYEQARNIANKHSLLSLEHDIFFFLCKYWKNRDENKYIKYLTLKFDIELQLRKTHEIEVSHMYAMGDGWSE